MKKNTGIYFYRQLGSEDVKDLIIDVKNKGLKLNKEICTANNNYIIII